MASTLSAALVATLGNSPKRARRLAALVEILNERGLMSLDDLAAEFGTSSATTRRDIAVLAEHGLIARNHGGAAPVDSTAAVPVSLRDTRFRAAKLRIARAAAGMIPHEPHAVALGGGTTTGYVAGELADRHALTVVTNSLTIANLISVHPHLSVMMTGGTLRPQSLELVGVLAEGTLAAVNIGTAILGADGVSAASGITTYDESEARTNHSMISNAQRTIVVADGSKIGKTALSRMATVGDIEILVTDESADPAELRRLRDAGVQVILA